jgi:ABC-type antimicrobial peptide transport system permease subunit
MGLRNLSRRKARTALTVVGVVIGTISIVVMISIGIGMNTNFRKQVMELGSLTTVTVNQYADVMDDKGNYVDSYVQKMDDSLVESIRALEHVKTVTPVYQASLDLFCKSYQSNCQVYAMDLSTLEGFGFPALTYGEYPDEANPKTLIFGSDSLLNFYNPTSSFYKPITIDPTKDKMFFMINDYEFQKDEKAKPKKIFIDDIALMEQTGSFEGYDWSCYMDINLYKRYYSEFVKTLKQVDRNKALKAMKAYDQIKINVDNVKNVKKVQEQIKELGFQTTSLNSMFEPMQQTSNMLQMVLGGVGAVAMLVSAISIANTMVMSIYERTKEIGVMKVLGCVITDIKKLFLFEAGMIGLIGGIIGIILSYIASFCINKFGGPLFQALLSTGSITGEAMSQVSMIPIWLPIAAAAFAMGVGIISGYYPARRATKISAIEAMKSE